VTCFTFLDAALASARRAPSVLGPRGDGVQARTTSRGRARAFLAMAVVALAAWLGAIAIALASDDSPGGDSRVAGDATAVEIAGAGPDRAGPANLPLSER
jgi:hypothetical protein